MIQIFFFFFFFFFKKKKKKKKKKEKGNLPHPRQLRKSPRMEARPPVAKMLALKLAKIAMP